MTEVSRHHQRRRWIAAWSAAGLVAAAIAVAASNTAASATTDATIHPLSTGLPSPTPSPTATPTPTPTSFPNGQHLTFTQSPANPVSVGTTVTYTVTLLTPRTSVYIEINAGRSPAGPLNYVAFGNATAPGGAASTVLTLQHTWTTPGTNSLVATLSYCDIYDCGAAGDFAGLATVVGDGSTPAPVTPTPTPTPVLDPTPKITPSPTATPKATPTPKVTPTPNVTPEPTRIPEPVVISFAASGTVTVPSIGGSATVAPLPVPIRVTINALRTGFTITPNQPALAPAKISGTIFGFIPWSVTESIAATAPVTGVIKAGVATATAPVQVTITAANVAGIAMTGATTCQTVKASPLSLASTGSLNTGSAGGSLTGSFTPGQFSNCGNFTGILNSLYAGAAQRVTLKLS